MSKELLEAMEETGESRPIPDLVHSADDPYPCAQDETHAISRLSMCTSTAAAETHLRGLIARIAQDDERALGALYDETVGRVYGMALRIMRNRQQAEEATEDTYFQIWRQALRFDPQRGSAMAWILTIARSRALDGLRRQDPAEPCAEPETLSAAEPSTDADPQDLLDAMQRSHRLHAALAALDALPRQLIALAFFRGLTHEEIAAEAAMPLGTVKSLIRRSLATLKSALSPDFA